MVLSLILASTDKHLKPLKEALTTLYAAGGRDIKCCEGLPIIKIQEPNRRGSFEFRGSRLPSGYYWFSPKVHEQGSAFGIEIGKYGKEQCDTKFVLDEKGSPSVSLTVTVD